MNVTLDEFKSEIEHYLDMLGDEEIIITKDGKSIAKITEPESLAAVIRSLRGTLPETATVEEAREERLKRHMTPQIDKLAILESLCGSLPVDATLEEARAERMAKYENTL